MTLLTEMPTFRLTSYWVCS